MGRGVWVLEEWKEIKGFEGKYQISSCGRVRSLTNTRGRIRRKPKVLKPRVSKRGYWVVDLSHPKNRKMAKIHRLIYHAFVSSIDSKQHIDHIDGNPLNNSFSNLRECTHSQNMQNIPKRKGCSSRYKGVTFCRATNKWRAQLGRKSICHSHIGRFNTELEAAIAYDYEATKHYGSNARTNHNPPCILFSFGCGIDI